MDELIPRETNEDAEPVGLLFVFGGFFSHHLKCLLDVNDGQDFVGVASFPLPHRL